jgi:CheY-like chemotaxis protein
VTRITLPKMLAESVARRLGSAREPSASTLIDAPETMHEHDSPLARPRQMRHRPLILFVGDNLDTRELYTLVLANHGFSVIESGEGGRTLDLAVSAAPDAIVLDLMKVIGADIIKRLRANAITFRTPILILTARDTPAPAEENLRGAADAECAKPCMPADFVDRLKAILISDHP